VKPVEWFDYLRLITGILALITCYNVARRSRRDWHTYTKRLREFSWVLQALLVLVFLGSLEQIAQNVPFGWRQPATFVVMLASFRASLRSEGLIEEV